MFGLDLSTVLIGVLGFLIIYWFLNRDKGRYPPGPRGFPIVGNLPHIKTALYESLEEWRKDHGDMFTFYMGGMPVVALCSYDLIHEAFVGMNEKFLDRPELYVMRRIFGKFGIIFAKFSQTWKDMRKLALVTMRDLGVGKSSLEEKIQDEVAAIFKEFDQFGDNPFQIRHIIQQAMVNVLAAVNFGKRFDYDDARMKRLLRLLNELFASNPVANPINIFPWLRFFSSKFERPIYILSETRKLVAEQVQEHRASFDPNNVRDFIDIFLKEEQEHRGEKNPAYSEGNLFQIIHDLFNAGSETAATSLSWAFMFLIHHQDVQKRMQKEIDEVVGDNRAPSMKDKPNMPYTDAVIRETMRVGNIAPVAPPHATIEDVNFRGYFLPKGTFVMASIWAVHHDTKYWTDPYKYNPNRWLDENGKVIRHDAFMPFSMGMRRCLGEQLANMELFILLTSLVQRYTFKAPQGIEMPSEHLSTAGVTRRPIDYLLCAQKR